LKRKSNVDRITKKSDIKYKRRIRKRKRILKFMRFLVLTILTVGTLVLLALSPLFNISSFYVSGNNNHSNNELIEVTDLVVGNNWFRTNGIDIKSILLFRSVRAEKNIKENCHYVKKANVSFSMPNKVKISVVEREPYVVSPYLDTNLLIDIEGYILDSKKDISDNNLPAIYGLGFDNCKLGQVLNAQDKKKFNMYKKVVEEIKILDNDKVYESGKAIFKLVNYIDVSDWDNVEIMLDSRIRVNLGNYKKIASYRLSFLREIFFNKLEKEDKGYLDFTSGDTPSFIPD